MWHAIPPMQITASFYTFIFAIEGVDKEVDHYLATWDKLKNTHQLFMFSGKGITIVMYLGEKAYVGIGLIIFFFFLPFFTQDCSSFPFLLASLQRQDEVKTESYFWCALPTTTREEVMRFILDLHILSQV